MEKHHALHEKAWRLPLVVFRSFFGVLYDCVEFIVLPWGMKSMKWFRTVEQK